MYRTHAGVREDGGKNIFAAVAAVLLVVVTGGIAALGILALGIVVVHGSGFAIATAGDHATMKHAFACCGGDTVADCSQAVERAVVDLENCRKPAVLGAGEYPLTDILFAGFDEKSVARMHVAAVGEHNAGLLPDRCPWQVCEVQHFSRRPFLSEADRDRLTVIFHG